MKRESPKNQRRLASITLIVIILILITATLSRFYVKKDTEEVKIVSIELLEVNEPPESLEKIKKFPFMTIPKETCEIFLAEECQKELGPFYINKEAIVPSRSHVFVKEKHGWFLTEKGEIIPAKVTITVW